MIGDLLFPNNYRKCQYLLEVHISGYKFYEPNTKLGKKLTRGNKIINPLDFACRDHGIAYVKINNLNRHTIL